MQFTDYLTVMLVNMVAGLVVLAAYYTFGLGREEQGHWAPAFGLVGLVALVSGLHMSLTWPIPMRWANVAFGEMTVLFGALFAAAAVAIAMKWKLHGVGIVAAIAGLVAVVVGIKLGMLGLTRSPMMTALGYVLTGAAGVLTPLVLARSGNRPMRVFASLVLLAAAGIWAMVGVGAYWAHLEMWK